MPYGAGSVATIDRSNFTAGRTITLGNASGSSSAWGFQNAGYTLLLGGLKVIGTPATGRALTITSAVLNNITTSITFDGGSSAATISNAGAGALKITAPVLLRSNLEITNAPVNEGDYALSFSAGLSADTAGLKTITTMPSSTVSSDPNFPRISFNDVGISDGAGQVALVHNSGYNLNFQSASNTFSGGLTINAGAVRILGDGFGDNSLGAAGGTITFGGGKLAFETENQTIVSNRLITLNAGGGTLSAITGTSVTWLGDVVGSGALTKVGAGSLILAGTNTQAGTTTVAEGSLQIGNGGTTGTLTGNLVNNAAVTFDRSDAATYAGLLSGTGTVTKQGAGVLTLGNANTYTGATAVNAGTLLINGNQATASGALSVASGATLGGSGATGASVTVADGGNLLGQAGQTLTMAGLTLANTSKLLVTLGAPSTSAIFQVNGDLNLDGTLDVTDAGAFGPGLYRLINYTGTLTDGGLVVGATAGYDASLLDVQTSVPNQVNLLFASGPTNIWAGGDGTWTAAATPEKWTDLVGDQFHSWQPQFAIFQSTPGVVTVDNTGGAVELTGAQFAANGFTVTGDALTLNTAAGVFRVGDGTTAGAGYTATITSAITGTGGIEKTDLGTLVLAGANTYSGTTLVTAGTLKVNGDQSAATGAVTVAAGATLGGSGTIGSTVTVQNGGRLQGAAGQVLTLGDLSLAGTSALSVALGAPSTSGLFQVNGNLVLDGTLDVTNAGSFGPGLYRLINYTGTLTDNGLAIGTAPVDISYLSVQTSVANQVNLIFDAGPRNLWGGGNGLWTASASSTAWANFLGADTGAWTSNFAIFQTTPGTVTVDTSAGAVALTGAQFAVSGYTVAGGTLTNNTSAAVFRVGDGTSAGADMSATISAQIAGTGGVNKTDLGTLVLSGANTYSGATTVSSGTLKINGNQSAATGAVTVASGAALGGSGTTGGAVTVANGGTLLGQSGQIFTMGNLTLNGTSNVNVALGEPGPAALFQVNGNLVLDGTLNITNAGGYGFGLYRLFNYTGSLTDNGLIFGTVPSGSGVFSLRTSVAQQVDLLLSDPTRPLPVWGGGSGTWSVNPALGGFSDTSGVDSGAWRTGFAIFQGTPGVVTIDTAAGAVAVTGLQFFVNGYTIAGGALTVNTADSEFRVGDGTAAGAGFTGTISAPLVGTGSINKTDLGTLVLAGTNTYTGGTTITGGVVQIANNANLGAATSGLTLAGGTLRTTAAFSSARPITLDTAGGTVDTGANALALSGVISGAGPLVKAGAGLLTVSGNNTYTGPTTIAGGGIFLSGSGSLSATTVASGASLSGTGTVRGDLANNGLLSPGASPGTITVSGNYTQGPGGTYLAELASATSYDKLTVSGRASLGGALTVSTLSGFVPQVGQVYTIMTATGGVSGTFSSVAAAWYQPSVMRPFQVSYSANAVTVGLVQRSFASLSGGAGQQAMGTAVDRVIPTNTVPVLQSVLNGYTSEADVSSALQAMSPQRYDRWFGQSVYAVESTVRASESRLADLGEAGPSGLWMELVRRESDFDADGESFAASGRANGILVGGDMRTMGKRGINLGLLFGYTDESLTLDDQGSQTDTERFMGALYAGKQVGRLTLHGVAGLGRTALTSRRVVAIPGYPQVAQSEANGVDAFASLRGVLPLTVRGLDVAPYAGLGYVQSWTDSFVETGAGDASLGLASRSAQSFTSRLGVTVTKNFTLGRWRLVPKVDLAWRQELLDKASLIEGELGSAAFVVRTRAPASSGFVLGLELQADLTERFNAYARLSYERNTAVDRGVNARVGVNCRF